MTSLMEDKGEIFFLLTFTISSPSIAVYVKVMVSAILTYKIVRGCSIIMRSIGRQGGGMANDGWGVA